MDIVNLSVGEFLNSKFNDWDLSPGSKSVWSRSIIEYPYIEIGVWHLDSGFSFGTIMCFCYQEIYDLFVQMYGSLEFDSLEQGKQRVDLFLEKQKKLLIF